MIAEELAEMSTFWYANFACFFFVPIFVVVLFWGLDFCVTVTSTDLPKHTIYFNGWSNKWTKQIAIHLRVITWSIVCCVLRTLFRRMETKWISLDDLRSINKKELKKMIECRRHRMWMKHLRGKSQRTRFYLLSLNVELIHFGLLLFFALYYFNNM